MDHFKLSEEIPREEAQRMLDAYSRQLDRLGYPATPYPDMEGRVGGNIFAGGKFDALSHAHWMCNQTKVFLRQGREAKAYRWLGMIQGLLFLGGVYSLGELRDHNGGVG